MLLLLLLDVVAALSISMLIATEERLILCRLSRLKKSKARLPMRRRNDAAAKIQPTQLMLPLLLHFLTGSGKRLSFSEGEAATTTSGDDE